ncbi:MAG: hypothetical protein ABR600_14245 [Actinomycetota bacterium]
MCRALTVLCVASGRPSLQALKKAAVAREWELTPGATTVDDALDQLDERKPHVLITWGAFAGLVKEARSRYPSLRIIAVGRTAVPDADVNVPSVKGVRDAILGVPPAGGPVRS